MVKIEEDLYQLELPRRRVPFNYQLNILRLDGQEERVFDPYQFQEYSQELIGAEPLALYRHRGAIPTRHLINGRHPVDGIVFSVYAPNADSVSVLGSFNQWNGRMHAMAKAEDGVWRLFIPGVQAESFYKYEIHDSQQRKLPLKSDPFARRNEQWPGLASITPSVEDYSWQDAQWMRNRSRDTDKALSIYEVHPGSWKRKADGGFMTFRELADQLIPYVQEMGFTHIQFMPLSEHPDYESWGYQPVGFFSPSSRYGSPDDLKYLVDKSHQLGIGVIMDWVPAQFPADDHGLACFDGTPLYEYQDPQRGWHPQWQAHIYDYGNKNVQDFLISNALFWLDEFHIDGLRIDALSSMLYLSYDRQEGEWQTNPLGGAEHLEAIRFLQQLNNVVNQQFPDCFTLAEEHTHWPNITASADEGGLGFHYVWNNGWQQDSLNYMRRAPEQRRFHHNQLFLSMIYSHSERYILPLDHGSEPLTQGALLTQMPGNPEEQFASLRAYLGYLFTHTGKKSLFMGTELASPNEWSIHQSLDWGLVCHDGPHKKVQTLVKDLNHLYRTTPALYQMDQSQNGFSWVVMDDHGQSVFAFVRHDLSGRSVLVICNMVPVLRNNYRIGVPFSGQWSERLNTDHSTYGGGDIRNPAVLSTPAGMHGYNQSIELTLPPLSTLILERTKE